MSSEHPAQQGESGHQGHDRQPGKDIARSASPAPDKSEAATPGQVHGRSKNAANPPANSGKDALHPGPRRDKAQTNPANRDKPQPDMQAEAKDL